MLSLILSPENSESHIDIFETPRVGLAACEQDGNVHTFHFFSQALTAIMHEECSVGHCHVGIYTLESVGMSHKTSQQALPNLTLPWPELLSIYSVIY